MGIVKLAHEHTKLFVHLVDQDLTGYMLKNLVSFAVLCQLTVAS